jgi:uncharacterized membrane protein
MADRGISWGGVLARIAGALVIVLLSYNPSGHSFFHWALRDFGDFGPDKILAGALLAAGWVLCIRTASTSLGTLGLVLSAAILGSLVWMLFRAGILDPDQPSIFAWVALVLIGAVLGIGLSWSLLRQRITGQVETD